MIYNCSCLDLGCDTGTFSAAYKFAIAKQQPSFAAATLLSHPNTAVIILNHREEAAVCCTGCAGFNFLLSPSLSNSRPNWR